MVSNNTRFISIFPVDLITIQQRQCVGVWVNISVVINQDISSNKITTRETFEWIPLNGKGHVNGIQTNVRNETFSSHILCGEYIERKIFDLNT
jgi:hypothetical protein